MNEDVTKTGPYRLVVPGMGSDHCAGIVRSSIERLEGIESIRTNISNHRVQVKVGDNGPELESIRKAVENAGYEVDEAIDESRDKGRDSVEMEEAYLKRAWRRFVIAAIPTTLIMILMMPHMFWQPIPGYLAIIAILAFPVVFLYGGWATHVSSWKAIKNRTANMDVLISMGSLPPYLIGLAGFIWPMRHSWKWPRPS